MARHLRRHGMEALPAHILGAVVSAFVWCLMMGFGFASQLPGTTAVVALALAIYSLWKTGQSKGADAMAHVQPDVAQAPPALPDTPAQPLPHGELLAGPPPAKAQPAPDLMHLVKGMMADGVFVQEEADYLFRWLGENRDRLDQYPYNAIYLRLENALADGVLDEDEAADLGEFFTRLVTDPGIVDVVALRAATPEVRFVPAPPEPDHVPAAPARTVRRKSTRTRRGSVIDRVMIRYQDSLGLESEREVNVHSFDGDYLKGYCHLRRSVRTFRADRIVGDIVRVETGEVLTLKKWWGEVRRAGLIG